MKDRLQTSIQHQLFHCCHCEMAHNIASFTELQEYLRKDQNLVEFRVSLDQLPDSTDNIKILTLIINCLIKGLINTNSL